MVKILEKRDLTPVTKMLVVGAPLVARAALPGQFVVVRVHRRGERIPLTIADYDRGAGTVTIVVQQVGKTSALLGSMKAGEEILDFLGPLGKPAPLRDGGHVICVGGGFGAAAIYPIVKALKSKGTKVSVIVGARTKELILLDKELEAACDRFYVTTDDGSRGLKGLVTRQIEALIAGGESIDEVVAVGPMVMMRVVAECTRPYGIATLVSMDSIMVDGTGLCGSCRVTVGGKVKFSCVDGPMFDGHRIDYEEAIRRSRLYLKEQEVSTRYAGQARP